MSATMITAFDNSIPLELNDTTSYVLDDDETVVGEGAKLYKAVNLQDGQIVFCPRCETLIDKTAGRHGKWMSGVGLGIPSAKVLQMRSGMLVTMMHQMHT